MNPAIFHNENFLAVDKPHSTLSVPSRHREEDSRAVLSLDLQNALGVRLFPVHRLDLEVSGVILYALNAEAHRAANRWFEERAVQKTYEALTEFGAFEIGQPLIWKSRLLRGKKRAYERPFGKPAETKATPIQNHIEEAVLEWKLEPKTGRPHQLRFELAKHAVPVLGDKLYGSEEGLPIEGAIALRSVSLDFAQCAEREALGLPQTLEVQGIWDWYLSLKTPPA